MLPLMSTLRQSCPSCNRQLELPTTALGKLAKCPACEATFTVTVSIDAPVSAPPPVSTLPSSLPSQSVSGLPADPIDPSRQPHQSQPHTPSRPVSAAPPAGPSPSDVEGAPQQHTGDSREAVNHYQTPQTGYGRAGQNPMPPQTAKSPEYLDANPFSSPLDDGMAASTAAIPYEQRDHAVAPVAAVGTTQITPRRIDEVFSATFSIFGERCGLLILAFLLGIVAMFLIVMVPSIIVQAIAEMGGDTLVGIVGLVLFPMMVVAWGYLSVGLARLSLAVARNTPSPMNAFLPPMGIVVRFLVGAAILTVIPGIVLTAVLSGLLDFTGRGASLSGLAAVVFFLTTVALSFVASWLLWSWAFVVSDGKATSLGALKTAVAVTTHNKGTSVLLMIATMVLSVVGTMVCYIGHLITAPLTLLMMAVAYLLMTNQEVSDPRVARQQLQQPPYGDSPF